MPPGSAPAKILWIPIQAFSPGGWLHLKCWQVTVMSRPGDPRRMRWRYITTSLTVIFGEYFVRTSLDILEPCVDNRCAYPKGPTMGILGFRKRRKDLRSALQSMRSQGIVVNGPYRRRSGMFVFSVANSVITEDELLRLQGEGKFETSELQEILAEIGKQP